MNEKESIQNELKEIAPGLKSGITTPYQVPTNYFENLSANVLQQIHRQSVKNPASLFNLKKNSWLTVAAAASVCGILFASLYFFTLRQQNESAADTTKWVKKEITNFSEESLSEFVQSHAPIQTTTPSVAAVDNKEITQLVKDIPTEELSTFLNEIPTNTP
ncbi:MAG: hypothetical protein EBR19_02200 [Chitinophagaceae bacterium]|nr:hypothetical protein [Chitinophagaceae bacterium]